MVQYLFDSQYNEGDNIKRIVFVDVKILFGGRWSTRSKERKPDELQVNKVIQKLHHRPAALE
jgi:hypothetical protein